MKRYPGKFEGCTDQRLGERLYQATLDGLCDEEFGDVQGNGWNGLLYRPDRKTSYILHEDSLGFFDYQVVPSNEIMFLWEQFSQDNEED